MRKRIWKALLTLGAKMDFILIGLIYASLFITIYWLQIVFISEREAKRIKKYPSVSVGIPVYNEKDKIADTITSVMNLDYPKDKIEIVVVDDGSIDGTGDAVKRFRNVRLIRQENSGKASALNTAIKNSRGELFACLDADSRIEKDALKRIVHHFSDERTASVICAVRVDRPKKFIEKLQWYEYLFSAFVRNLLSKVNSLNMTPGVFSVYRKNILLKVGKFDEAGMTEDFEMAMRLHKNGYNIKIENKSVGYTAAPSTLSSLIKQRERWARGYIHNGIKYRDMFFNSRYGVLGTFHLPTTYLGVFLLIMTTSIILFKLVKKLFSYALDLIDFKSDIIKLFDAPNFRFFLNVNNILYFPILIGLIIVLYSFYRAHKLANERLRYPFAFAFYILYYGFFHSFVWIKAIMKETIRTKRRW